ncbi:conjugative transfer domain protein, partial [Orientia tsutsugamushi str. UT144]
KVTNAMRSIESTMDGGDRVFFDKFKVNRPYGNKRLFFCTSDPKDGCKHLKIQNCELKTALAKNQ